MKITEINTYFVRPGWGFVEIITDEGLRGWGEVFGVPVYQLMGGGFMRRN